MDSNYEVSHKIIGAWINFTNLIPTMEVQNENVQFAIQFMKLFQIQNMNYELSLLKLDERDHIQLLGFIARNQHLKPVVQSFLDKALENDPQKFSETCPGCIRRCVPGPIMCKSCKKYANITSEKKKKSYANV